MRKDLALTAVIHIIGRHVTDGLVQPLVIVVFHEASDRPTWGSFAPIQVQLNRMSFIGHCRKRSFFFLFSNRWGLFLEDFKETESPHKLKILLDISLKLWEILHESFRKSRSF